MQVEVLKEVDKRPMDDDEKDEHDEMQSKKRQKARDMSMTMHACIHEVSRSSWPCIVVLVHEQDYLYIYIYNLLNVCISSCRYRNLSIHHALARAHAYKWSQPLQEGAITLSL